MFTEGNYSDHLIRSNIWTSDLKRVLEDDLMGTKYVRLLTDFPDGTTYNIPSLGQAEVQDFEEDRSVVYTGMDTGNFTFTIDQYKASATYISEKFRQDSMWASQVEAAFVPAQHRALAVAMETNILSKPNAGQTASDTNSINGAEHRWVGSGTSETISLTDFAKAQYALMKANVPMSNLVAIVDPTVAYTLATQTNMVNLMTNQPQWNKIVNDGIVSGMRFVTNVYGFDVYTSNYLPTVGAETIGGKTTAQGVTNLFFSAAPGDTLPIIGLIKQSPKVESEYKKDLQREEYVTTCRYGFKLYRPDNMVIVLTDTDQVA